MSDLFSLKTIHNGMFYRGGVLLPLKDPLGCVPMTPVERLERTAEQRAWSDPDHFKPRWHDGAKGRQHPHRSDKSLSHYTRRLGQDIDYYGLARAQLRRGPQWHCRQQPAIGS